MEEARISLILIKPIRKQAGLTQKQLAGRIGVTQALISQWECGKAYPGTKNLLSLSKALGISIDAMISENEGA